MSNFFESHWVLSLLLILPMAGAALCLIVQEEKSRYVAMLTSVVAFAISLPLFWTFRSGTAAIQNYVSVPWIEAWGIGYTIGIDGISILMVLLTTFVTPLAILASFTYIQRHQRAYYAMLLLLLAAMIGVFVSLDMFLFFLFWEIMLIPMYFIIGVWGGKRRVYAAVKFFLFTAIGSLLMLVAIVVIVYLYYRQYGVITFAYNDLVQLPIGRDLQFVLFSAFALAFAIKVPLFPLHTWLPDAHVEAVGTILVLSLVGIIYGAWVAAVQPDAKKLVAYTSVAHLGFVMMGLFSLTTQGIQGGILQMVNHGISTGALFLLVGMLYERRHTRMIDDFGGIAKVMPVFAAAFLLVALSSIGLPGVIFAAAYMLPMVQRMLYGEVDREENRVLSDIGIRERLVLAPALVMIVLIGVYPQPFLSRTSASVEALIEQVEHRAVSAPVQMGVSDLRFDRMPILGIDE